MYVYIKSEPGLWTVGFYSPNGKWNTDSDHNSKQEAGERVAFLNGQQVSTPIPILTPCDAIGFAEWLNETNWAEKETWGKYDPPSMPNTKELYSLYKMRKIKDIPCECEGFIKALEQIRTIALSGYISDDWQKVIVITTKQLK